MKSSTKAIHIRGARTHNLKDIHLDLPRDALIVVTGLSGSGKSSLAFDTLYAEGQRRFVESLSSYARQFLEQMQKPDVDQIEGLPPTVAIEQLSGSSNPRSTVATTTEIYDYVRALFARVGVPHCWKCARPISAESVAEITDHILENWAGRAIILLAPLVRGRRGKCEKLLKRIGKEGLVRIRLNGTVVRLDELPPLNGNRVHDIDAVVDRLTVKPQVQSRLADSLETALLLGGGVVLVAPADMAGGDLNVQKQSGVDVVYTSQLVCRQHLEVVVPDLTPRLFSFNSPYGACRACDGLGTELDFDEQLIIPDDNLSLSGGALLPWSVGGRKLTAMYAATIRQFCAQFGVESRAPFRNLGTPVQRILLYGTTPEDEERYGAAFEGVIPNMRRRLQESGSEAAQKKLRVYLSESACRQCHGSRLCPEARAVRVGEASIDQVVRMNIATALGWAESLTFSGERKAIAEPLLKAIQSRLLFMNQVGVGYLTLDRSSATLSGGEAQRIRLATQVGSGLVGVCYVLDEPTIGLHPRDSLMLVKTLKYLRDLGNTVVVVEHDEETINAADHIVDMGPGAGEHGGEVVTQGTLPEILKHGSSCTAQYLSGRKAIPVPRERRRVDWARAIEIRGAGENNLKNIDVTIPLTCLVCVTGVSGSGKSTLVNQILVRAMKRKLYHAPEKPGHFGRLVGTQAIDKIIEIDQSPIGRTPRSNPATYVGVFDLIRQLYAKTREAKIRGYSPSRFSFNVKGGRCESCQGQGTKRIEMHFLPDIYVTCDACKGTRYNRETLEVRYRGKHIAQVLDLRVDEARTFFDSFAKIKQLLQALREVGLGYVTLGQASVTLSGGEAQRVKLASELGKSPGQHTLYVLDEPTTGLHFEDIQRLLHVLNRLVDQGNTVLIIEHHLDVIKVADWIIDLGPEGGDAGGELVVAGSPETVAESSASHTGRFLSMRLNRRGSPGHSAPAAT